MSQVDEKELENRFTYHSPKGDQQSKYHSLRELAKTMAQYIVANVPESREQALALTKLEESVMWANAGIARRS